MGSYKKVGDDILKEWLDFREEELGSLTCKEDKEHFIYFEEISTNILNNVSGNNIEYVKSQLKKLDDNFPIILRRLTNIYGYVRTIGWVLPITTIAFHNSITYSSISSAKNWAIACVSSSTVAFLIL